MAPGLDAQTRLADELGPAPVERARALGQRCQRIEARERAGERREWLDVGLQRVDQLLVQQLLAGERAVLRRERLVFEGLQLGRDESLGVFQRLAALVVGRHFARLTLRHLDVEAVNLVELHPQVGDAGARALARLEVDQVGIAIGADAAQLVEVGIEAGRDDTAVAQQHGGLVRDRGFEALENLGRRGERFAEHFDQRGRIGRQLRTQRRQRLQGCAQAGQLARPHLAQGDAGGDAFDIADAAQRVAQVIEARAVQSLDRIVPLARGTAFALRVREPLAQRARAHAGAAGVEQREQRGRVFAAQGLREFEVAMGDLRQVEQVSRALHLEPADVRERLALRVFGKAEQRRASRVRGVRVLRIEAGEAGDPQLRAKFAQAECAVELPRWPMGKGELRSGQRGRHLIAIDQHFGRGEAGQPRTQLGLTAFGQTELAAGQRQPRQAPHLADLGDREQQRVALVGEQLGVGHGARGHHTHHLAFDWPLGGGHVADLLADRDRLAQPDQLGEVAVERHHRHTGHRDRLAATGAARGQGDVEQAIGLARIVEKQLVEIAHAIEQERVGMVGLDAGVLRHHWRQRWRWLRCRCGRHHSFP